LGFLGFGELGQGEIIALLHEHSDRGILEEVSRRKAIKGEAGFRGASR